MQLTARRHCCCSTLGHLHRQRIRHLFRSFGLSHRRHFRRRHHLIFPPRSLWWWRCRHCLLWWRGGTRRRILLLLSLLLLNGRYLLRRRQHDLFSRRNLIQFLLDLFVFRDLIVFLLLFDALFLLFPPFLDFDQVLFRNATSFLFGTAQQIQFALKLDFLQFPVFKYIIRQRLIATTRQHTRMVFTTRYLPEDITQERDHQFRDRVCFLDVDHRVIIIALRMSSQLTVITTSPGIKGPVIGDSSRMVPSTCDTLNVLIQQNESWLLRRLECTLSNLTVTAITPCIDIPA